MYFRNYRLRKSWLVKCLKSLVSEHLARVNMLNSLKNCIAAFPPYFFITLAKSELENVRLCVSKILRVFLTRLIVDDKYSLRNRKILLQPIQLELSKEEKICSRLFPEYTEIYIKCSTFWKKDDFHSLCIFEIRDRERCG